ncbi:MAG: DNA mismatch repair endonuclease MutL [Oscillospiraceae bacterium]|nr:DNA mismatch repair endonuclease MutL [Oscillospiraceae bacterium]
MPKIQQLSQHIADLIAAGEVVERPASCVKELIENAIDAGAKNITVEIQNGGMRLLRVTDDGCGMEPLDARTAFLRHATSKLRTKEDLSQIGTLGFRGEALAAIASVSRIDLMTKTHDAAEGVSLHLEAGTVLSEQPVGCPDGTTIVVRDLFYNTPARMKFMKSDMAESAAVFSCVQHLALAHPEISFRYIRDAQEQLHTAGDGSLYTAIYTVLGRQLANDMVEVKSTWEKISVLGYVTKPTCTRGSRSAQQFYVNGRFIKSKLLTAALEQAYKNQIMTGRFPSCVLQITLGVQAVDVNVHPAKTEVKFLNERDVFDAVHYAVLATLGKTPARPEMKLPEPKPAPQPQPKSAPKADFFRTVSSAEFRASAKPAAPVFRDEIRLPKPAPTPVKPVLVIPDEHEHEQMTIPVPAAPAPKAEPAPKVKEDAPWRIIGEALNTYILVEQEDTVFLIDKHAAHERILFEKLKAETQPVMRQMLLQPLAADLSREESAAVLEHASLLDDCGYGVEDFGDGTVLLRHVPEYIDSADALSSLAELAAKLLSGASLSASELRDELLHSIACKAAIKAGWHTEPAERAHLVREVMRREELKYCPHGRPICITLTRAQLEKQFKRT